IGPDPRNFNQRVSLGRNDLLIRTFPNAYDQAASQGELNVIYLFGQQGINEEDIKIDMNGITIPGFEKPITYATEKEYPDF
ncbi:hypothetical protein V6266_16580, partial [Enterobacter asburiae]